MSVNQRSDFSQYRRLLVHISGSDDEARAAQIRRLEELAALGGFVFGGRGNKSGFINHLIKNGNIIPASELAEQDLDVNLLLFICPMEARQVRVSDVCTGEAIVFDSKIQEVKEVVADDDMVTLQFEEGTSTKLPEGSRVVVVKSSSFTPARLISETISSDSADKISAREFISAEQIDRILRTAETGTPISEVCEIYDISESQFYEWRKLYQAWSRPLPHKVFKAEHINRTLRQVETGASMSAVCKMHEVSEEQFREWQELHQLWKDAQANDQKQLELENERLRKIVVQQLFEIDELNERLASR